MRCWRFRSFSRSDLVAIRRHRPHKGGPVAAAEAELGDAIAYYAQIDIDLAFRFQDAVEAAVTGIAENPESYQLVLADLRRARLRRFPHALYYRVVRTNTVVVVACIHPRRDPAIWMERR